MRLNEIETAWHDLIDRIVLDWPELGSDQLAAIAGNRARFINHMAAQYELTKKEAEEVVDLWLWRFSAGQANSQAA
ncbi:MAG: hypothetical protein AAGK37_18935 [Pseudomonadota bacterium]